MQTPKLSPDRIWQIARPAFFAYTSLLVVLWIAGLPLQLAATQLPCAAKQCTSVVLSREDFAQLIASGASPVFYSAYMTLMVFLLDTLVGAAIAVLIVTRRPRDWAAILLAVPMISHSFNFMDHPGFIQQQYPGLWFLTMLPGVAIQVFWLPAFSVLPDGKWVPRWSRWLIPYVAALGVFVYLGQFLVSVDAWTEIVAVTFSANFPIIIAFQIWRFSRATPNERVRLKWVLVGLLASFVVPILLRVIESLAPDTFRIGTPGWFLVQPAAITSPILMYLCIGIAILRYRLFDIDVIIRRTLIYSTLTAILVLFYLGSVVVLQQILRGLSGQGSDLAIILSTLGIAALFNPLRQRVQGVIDRRFYRHKYNAQKILAQFGARVRDEVELNRLTDDLLSTVEETMRPASLSLWLKTTNDKGQTPRL